MTSGLLEVRTADGSLPVRPGHAAYVSAAAGPLTLVGDGAAWVAEPGG